MIDVALAMTERAEHMNDSAGAVSPFTAMQNKVRGSNINHQTLLATDFLNHFNEVAMIFEMLADVPECLDDIRAWRPKTYKEHFVDSAFSDKNLAIEAYDHVPKQYLLPFETTIEKTNSLIIDSVGRLEAATALGEREHIELATAGICHDLHEFMSILRGIIHGAVDTLKQDEIDTLLDC